jgi:hypothetical protein
MSPAVSILAHGRGCEIRVRFLRCRTRFLDGWGHDLWLVLGTQGLRWRKDRGLTHLMT